MKQQSQSLKIILLTALYIIGIGAAAFGQQKQGRVPKPANRYEERPTVVGRARLEVQYALNATDVHDEHTYIDLRVLQVGDSISKHYSRFLELDDSLRRDFLEKNPHAGSIPHQFYAVGRRHEYWSEYQYTEIFTEGDRQTFYARMPFAMERYNGYYTEPAAQQQWTLHAESQILLDQPCQRATCHWRGRDFEAWFAPGIPVRLGPWNFGGLPGLILKLYDTERLYTYEAVALRTGSFPITRRDYTNYHPEKRKRMHRLQVDANRDHSKTGGVVSRSTGLPLSNPHPYEPLEKE